MQGSTHETAGNNYAVRVERGSKHLIERIASEWRKLAAEGPCDEPFYDPSWVLAYIQSFEGGSPVTLVTVRRDGVLRGVLPMVERTIGAGPLSLRMKRAAANAHFPRFDIVHGTGDSEIVAVAIWKCLQEDVRWDVLQFESAPEGGVAARLLEIAAASGHETLRYQPDASPFIDLTTYPDDFDEIVSRLRPKLRSSLRSAIKRLRAQGEVSFRVIDATEHPDRRAAAVQSFYRIEASGWKGEAGTAILSQPATEAFYDRIVTYAIETESLALAELRCNEELVASKLDVVWNDTLYELKFGYNESYRKCSPGHLAVLWAIQAGRESGLAKMDNCGRSEAYKLAWTSLARPFATCFIGNRTVGGHVAWTLLFRVGLRVRDRLGRFPLPAVVNRLLQ